MSIKSKDEKISEISLLQKITALESEFTEEEFPLVSIIIPTYNCAHLISITLECLLRQKYKNFEILIVDAGSTDRTLELIRNFHDSHIHLYSVSEYQRYEMLNKGILHAKGEYLNFLFPGDYYISSYTLKQMMALALKNQSPDLVFCGTLLRDGRSEVKILFRDLTLSSLQKGNQPTSLQSCWFRADIFNKIGKFRTSYTLRGGFDLMCRFIQDRNLRAVSSKKILTDYDLRWVTWRMVLTHFWETLQTIWRYFGFFKVLKWLIFYQKDGRRFLRLWKRSLKAAFRHSN